MTRCCKYQSGIVTALKVTHSYKQYFTGYLYSESTAIQSFLRLDPVKWGLIFLWRVCQLARPGVISWPDKDIQLAGVYSWPHQGYSAGQSRSIQLARPWVFSWPDQGIQLASPEDIQLAGSGELNTFINFFEFHVYLSLIF